MRILLTRPAEESERDALLFKRYGFDPVLLPLITFRVLNFEVPPLEKFDYLYIGSKRAADFFLEKVKKLPKTLRVIAVGEKTAEFLKRKYSVEPFLILNGYSENLVELGEKGELKRGKLLAPLPKVNTGNVKKLERLGFEVETLEVYETVPIIYPREKVLEKLKYADIVFFASPSAYRSMLLNLQKDKKPLSGKIIVAIGKTTKRAIEEDNLKVGFVPSRPSAEILAKELAEAVNGIKGENP